MHPQFEIFNLIFEACLKVLPNDTFDFVDGGLRPYPFVYVGESIVTDLPNKSKTNGTLVQTVHIWDLRTHRKAFMQVMEELSIEFRKLDRTPNYRVSVRSMDPQVIPENTDSVSKLHGVIDLTIYFS